MFLKSFLTHEFFLRLPLYLCWTSADEMQHLFRSISDIIFHLIKLLLVYRTQKNHSIPFWICVRCKSLPPFIWFSMQTEIKWRAFWAQILSHDFDFDDSIWMISWWFFVEKRTLLSIWIEVVGGVNRPGDLFRIHNFTLGWRHISYLTYKWLCSELILLLRRFWGHKMVDVGFATFVLLWSLFFSTKCCRMHRNLNIYVRVNLLHVSINNANGRLANSWNVECDAVAICLDSFST